MATFAFIKTKWLEYDLLNLVIIDDTIFNKIKNGGPFFNSPTGTLVESYEFLDSLFGTDLWQSTAFPIVTSTFLDSKSAEIKQWFPGAILVNSDSFSATGQDLYFNGEAIPSYKIYGRKDETNGGSVYFCLSNNDDYMTIPFIYTRSSGKNTTSGGTVALLVGSSCLIIKEECYNNGVLTNLSGDNTVGVFFEVRRYGNGVCESYASRLQSSLGGLSWWNGDSITEWSSDPFNPGGNTESGGGGGSFDNTSTPIDIPGLPTVSAASTGFISLFNPTLSQLNELASYMWSDLFDLDTLKKLFADPMDVILGLSIVPVAVPSSGTKEVRVGNISTGISLNAAASQFVEVDCGSIDVQEYWGAYLDYEPYTQAQIFLPYIGTRPISVDEIMGKTVRVVYHVDILTGACCCFVKCGDSVLYTFNGQCSIPIPVTSVNYTSIINGILSIAGSTAALVATGGQAAPLIAAGAATGATKSAVAKGASARAQLTNAEIGTGSSVANSAVNQMKPQIAKSGSISGGAGILNMQTPYLILIRPRQALPSKQNEFIGYPSLVTVQLSELTGYTEIQSVHLDNINATSQELDEIEGMLKGGVIF